MTRGSANAAVNGGAINGASVLCNLACVVAAAEVLIVGKGNLAGGPGPHYVAMVRECSATMGHFPRLVEKPHLDVDSGGLWITMPGSCSVRGHGMLKPLDRHRRDSTLFPFAACGISSFLITC